MAEGHVKLKSIVMTGKILIQLLPTIIKRIAKIPQM